MRPDDFSPPVWAQNGWLQTLGALWWPSQPTTHPEYTIRTHTLALPDGDALALTLHDHDGGPRAHRAVLVHGLCGDQESNYMRRSAQRLLAAGYDLCLVNLRGSGPGYALASLPYHAGRSEDIAQVIGWLHTQNSQQPLDLIGFSLGANIVLKYLAEASQAVGPTVNRALAICPPIDLEASCHCLANSPLGLADRFFTRLLVEHVERVHQAREDLESELHWPKDLNVRQFDELYTAPRAGFASASHYYQEASAQHRLGQIQIPTKIIWAQDDPLIDQAALAHAKVSSSVTMLPTTRGGHIGYMQPLASGLSRFWLVDQLPRLLRDFDA